MLKLYLMLVLAFMFISCETKEANNENKVLEKAVNSYGAQIERAKATEALLQKKADSISSKFDSLSVPR